MTKGFKILFLVEGLLVIGAFAKIIAELQTQNNQLRDGIQVMRIINKSINDCLHRSFVFTSCKDDKQYQVVITPGGVPEVDDDGNIKAGDGGSVTITPWTGLNGAMTVPTGGWQ